MPAWLAVKRRKYVFFLTLYGNINDMKLFLTLYITPQPCHSHFFLLIAANLAITEFLGWKWSLWPVPARLEVQQRKYVFLLTLIDSINDMK